MVQKKVADKSKKSPHILSDHKKVGKILVPPLLQLGKFNYVKWIDTILPEILWLGLINEYFGLQVGTEIGLSLAKEAADLVNINRKSYFAATGSYINLTSEQKKTIVENLKHRDTLTYLQESLYSLVYLYPECPLKFLFDDSFSISESKDFHLKRYKLHLGKFFDNESKPCVFMISSAIYIAFATDMLKVLKGTSLANFPAVKDYPLTEESKRIASSMEATINVFFGTETFDIPSAWSKYFWNRGLELQTCEL